MQETGQIRVIASRLPQRFPLKCQFRLTPPRIGSQLGVGVWMGSRLGKAVLPPAASACPVLAGSLPRIVIRDLRHPFWLALPEVRLYRFAMLAWSHSSKLLRTSKSRVLASSPLTVSEVENHRKAAMFDGPIWRRRSGRELARQLGYLFGSELDSCVLSAASVESGLWARSSFSTLGNRPKLLS